MSSNNVMDGMKNTTSSTYQELHMLYPQGLITDEEPFLRGSGGGNSGFKDEEVGQSGGEVGLADGRIRHLALSRALRRAK